MFLKMRQELKTTRCSAMCSLLSSHVSGICFVVFHQIQTIKLPMVT
jgi:hypothetical protein